MNALTTAEQQIGQLANTYAAANIFSSYKLTKADNSLRAQYIDLTAFAEFLRGLQFKNVTPETLYTDPNAWGGVTWGLVDAFRQLMLMQGFAVATINRRLATVKVYARLAYQAGILPLTEFSLIREVKGFDLKLARKIDEKRPVSRVGSKKSEATPVTVEQATRLKSEHPNTPQGRRDRLLMCLLLDHGLRIEEVSLLEKKHFDLGRERMIFDRPKVDLTDQTHELSYDTLAALRLYMQHGDCPENGSIWRKSVKGGALGDQGVTVRNLSFRVTVLGSRLGINNLSPHDCRHYWATFWSDKVDALRLQEAGGWSSLEMPRRYVRRAQVANKGMR